MSDRVSPSQQIRNIVHSFRTEPSSAPVTPESLVDAAVPKDWTVLAYLEGRDRLSNSVDVALNAMEEIGSTDSVNLVAQATLEPELGDRRFQSMGEVDTRRYYLTQDSDLKHVQSPVLEQFDHKKRLNSQSLEDFLCWGIEKFPAKHVAVVIKKHGLGFAANGSSVPLSARELRETLEKVEDRTGVKPDLLCWDSCNMQQWEVAYELKDRTAVMTGSPEAISAVEFPYQSALYNLVNYPKQQDASTMGKTVVQAYAADAPQTTQFAVEMAKLPEVGQKMKAFVDQILEHKVPQERLYTNLMKSASFEPKESLHLAYNFRDLAGFLSQVAQDPNIESKEVKQAADQALQALNAAQLDRNVHPQRAHLKGLSNEVGPSAFMPWKQPSDKLHDSYAELSWAKETGWDRLLDYTLQAPDQAAATPQSQPEQSQSFGVGKLGLYAYKKYVSPYLLTDCPYDTTCSEFARIALQELGPWEGAKWAFMRVMSCQDGAIGGHDDLPHDCKLHLPNHAHQPAPSLPEITLQPPVAVEKSNTRKRVEDLYFQASRTAAKTVGGSLAAIVSGATGAILGGIWGGKAGAGSLEQYNQGLEKIYGHSKVHSLEKVQQMVAGPGQAVHDTLAPHTGQTVAKIAGSVAGSIAGFSLGLLGGAAAGYRFFGGFAGLGAQNLAKESVGEMPVHYKTAQILQQSYHSSPTQP